MRIICSRNGARGHLVICEEADGSLVYLEDDVFQSHGSPGGKSAFVYVQMMESFLGNANDVLVLGCGGGNLATMLSASGKTVTVVDHNPISFEFAHRYFGMPGHITCVIADFREFLLSETRCFDGIAIYVGGPGFSFEDQFDPSTCRSIKDRLAPSGRVIMNAILENDFDPVADDIANALSDDELGAWIFDQPGQMKRNALIACLPRRRPLSDSGPVTEIDSSAVMNGAVRRPRRAKANGQTRVIDIRSVAPLGDCVEKSSNATASATSVARKGLSQIPLMESAMEFQDTVIEPHMTAFRGRSKPGRVLCCNGISRKCYTPD